MNHPHANHQHSSTHYLRWVIWVLFGLALMALIIDHRAHLFGILPYALLLACPLMHLFMHPGHGRRRRRHGDHGQPAEPSDRDAR